MTDATLASEAEGAIADLIDMVYTGQMPIHLPRCAIAGQPHDRAVPGEPEDCAFCIIGEVRQRLGRVGR